MKLRNFVAAVLLSVSSTYTFAFNNIAFGEILVQDFCKDWSTFPQVYWTNNTGATVEVVDLEFRISSSQSMQGEFGMWAAKDGMMFASHGVTNFTQPNGPINKILYFPSDARFKLAPGEKLYLTINCGPAGVNFNPFYYWGVLQFHYAW